MITHFISIREPYDEWILSGRKKVETRTMRMSEKFLNKRIGIYVPEKKKIVGTIKVVGQVSYPDVRSFRAAYPDHLVAPGSAYDIKPGGKKIGLVLREPVRIAPEIPKGRVYPSMINKNPKKQFKWRKVSADDYVLEGKEIVRLPASENAYARQNEWATKNDVYPTLRDAKRAIEYEIMRERGIQKNPRDYCYRKIKKKFRVFPSRYAGFALARCRRKLGKNPVPPAAVARVACRGLAKRRKYKRGGTAVGVARGRDLCNRRNVSMRTIKRLSSYFARHRASRAENAKRKSDPTSAAAIADDLWGGSPGWAWAKRVG